MVDDTGRVVPLTGSGKHALGRAMESGAAAGALIEILLIPNPGLLSA